MLPSNEVSRKLKASIVPFLRSALVFAGVSWDKMRYQIVDSIGDAVGRWHRCMIASKSSSDPQTLFGWKERKFSAKI